MTKPWIINLGLPKSGTTTLHMALESAGLKVAEHLVRKGSTRFTQEADSPVSSELYEGYYKRGDPLARLAGFDALAEISILQRHLSQWPQTDFGLLQTIRVLYPKTKFVATWRDPEAISDSMMRWRNLGTQRVPKLHIPGLPPGYGFTTDEQVRWITAHYLFLEMMFAGDPNFLLLDVAAPDAPNQLAAFTGAPIAWWGKANVNPDTAPTTV
ncbi:sulfotransferase [Pseudoprimorskyibacter insulae]|uniref:Uncharacterized protein n=1 Tax=Pseudoprimorskyibacter insulae TaxID=1695997 RepID=A0A2R8AX99_9RHOB|nr:sulfotransferase [Pseudoprimorskyibacter insulae]SPF80494.1 hypothetical protein PRI8871_02304 [Pseudoprimorskyibacter insulae]